jgi:hypothetical protein
MVNNTLNSTLYYRVTHDNVINKNVDKLNELLDRFENLKTPPQENFSESVAKDLQQLTSTVWGFFNQAKKPTAQKPSIDLSTLKIEQKLIDNLVSIRRKLNQLSAEIERQSEAELKKSNLEKKFAQVYLEFVTCKCQILFQAHFQLQSFQGQGQGSNPTLDQRISQLQSDLKKEWQETQPIVEEINQCLKNIDQEIEIQKKEFQKKYVAASEKTLAELQRKHCESQVLLSQMASLPNFSKYQAQLEDNASQLTDVLKTYEEQLARLGKAITSLEGKSTQEVEKLCQSLTAECLLLEHAFEKHRLDLVAQKRQVLREIAHSPNSEVASDKVEQLMNSFVIETDEITQALKEITRYLQKAKENQSFGPVTLDSFEKMETWTTTSWGQLLVEKRSVKEKIYDQLGVGFENTIHELKEARRKIKSMLQQLKADQVQKKEELNQELNEINRILYHTLLQRLIDVIGEKQKLLKKEGSQLPPQAQKLLQIDIQLLNAKFEELFTKYQQIPVPKKSFMAAAYRYTLDTIKAIVSFGYFNHYFASPEELKQKKHYADLGYDMVTDVSDWLKTLQVKEGESLVDCLKREVEAFTKWADKHPHTAIALASDMALTCAIIGGQSYMDQFISTMRVKAYTTAFLEGWSQFSEEQVPESQEELKYRALADLCRYAPMMSATFRAVLTSDYSSPQQVLFKTGAEILKTAAVQQAHHFLPDQYAGLALQVLNVIKGESFQRILEEQRNLELMRIGGTVKQLLEDPTGFLNKVKFHARVWWQTLQQSQGKEKIYRVATQILLPIAGMAVASWFIHLAFVGSITVLTGISLGVGALSSATALAYKINQLLNYLFPTRVQVLERIKAERKHLAENQIAHAIQQQRLAFVRTLRKKKVLPPVLNPEAAPQLSSEQKLAYQQIKSQLVNDLIPKLYEKLSQRTHDAPLTIVDCIQAYQATASQLEQLVATHIQTDIELREVKERHYLQTFLINEVKNSLIDQWLNRQIEAIFTAKAIAFSQQPAQEEEGQDPNALIDEVLKKFFPNPEDRRAILSQL